MDEKVQEQIDKMFDEMVRPQSKEDWDTNGAQALAAMRILYHNDVTVNELAVFWTKWYMLAGHKRMSRALITVLKDSGD
jgi:hypothetical protein